jgi:hypothetical protein
MIEKFLSLFARFFHLQRAPMRPGSRFQRGFEWQSEFLFVPEKRPLSSGGTMTRTCLFEGSRTSRIRIR